MCPICGELETGSGQTLVPAALGGDCKVNAAFVLDVNADATACLLWVEVAVGSPGVWDLKSCRPLPGDATEHRWGIRLRLQVEQGTCLSHWCCR